MRRSTGGFAALMLLAVLALTACVSEQPSIDAGPTTGFPADVVFDYQLGGSYEPADDVRLVVRDRTERPAAGKYSVCYVNGFQTQPGDLEDWPDETVLQLDGEPLLDPDWPDEALLDTSSERTRDAILGVIEPWIRKCADDGFDAVEFDNLDSYTRSEGALTLDDNVALATALVRAAHDAGLEAGQKNAAEQAATMHDDAGFDFAVAEECAAYSECDAYTDAYGASVIDIEYTDQLPHSFAEMCADPASPSSMILRDRDLVTPDDPAHVFEPCPAG